MLQCPGYKSKLTAIQVVKGAKTQQKTTYSERSIMIAWLTGRITTQTLVRSLHAVAQANERLFTTAASANTEAACRTSAK